MKSESDEGYKCLNYAAFSVVAIKGLQELNTALAKKVELITSQEQQINDLKADFKKLETALSQCCTNYSTAKNELNNLGNSSDKPALEQNAPNPFNKETAIRYYLPANSTAVLMVLSLEGQEVLTTPIEKTGYGEVRISCSTMAAGTYTYTLLVNGMAVESKIMVLTK